MNNLILDTENTFPSLLELAANNDIDSFKRSVERDPSGINEIGQWYGRQKGSKQMVLQERTPLMVAATYGSVDVMKLILLSPDVDVNQSCGPDKSTALHCAASGGSIDALEVVRLLLEAGADPNLEDASGHWPAEIVVVPPRLQAVKKALEELLATDEFVHHRHLRISTCPSKSYSPPPIHFTEDGSPSDSESNSSSGNSKFNEAPASSPPEKKEYPIDPTFPDIKNSIYTTDEFRMYSFKVRPCSRAYSHDWTECPFVHPGENARRRDPRKYHYSCVPCPDFRKGACRRGDMCEYAHGVFECWLHPAQYRTRLCKDNTSCTRRVCFFAHTTDELRPLYVSTGSAVPSPRSNASAAAAMDFAAAMNLLPGSPSSVSVMSPSPFTPPMSPANGISHSTMSWTPQNVPLMNLPGSNLQSSRLRSALNARDIPAEELSMLREFDLQQHKQLYNELSCLTHPSTTSNALNRPVHSKTLAPSNLEDLFSAESLSPCYSDQATGSGVYSPTHKSAFINQFQQQHQSMLSPINTNFSPRSVDHSLLQASFGAPSPGRMSPRSVEPISPINSRVVSLLAQREKQPQQFRSVSSRDLGSPVGPSPSNSWSKWGSSNGKPDWAINADELNKLRGSNSFELANNGEDPDLSWVQSLVRESPPEIKERTGMPISSAEASAGGSKMDSVDQVMLGAWLEQMQLDQLMAQ